MDDVDEASMKRVKDCNEQKMNAVVHTQADRAVRGVKGAPLV